MVLHHQTGDSLTFGSHYVVVDTVVVDHPAYELYTAHDASSRFTVKHQSFTVDYEVNHHKYYRECVTLGQLPRHPRVIPLTDTLEDTKERNSAGYQLYDCVLVGSLRSFAVTNRLTEQQVFQVLKQLCETLDFVHTNGFVHRNVSLDSVYLRQDAEWILGDFSATMPINYELSDSERMRDTELMTLPGLRAPEQMHVATIKQVGPAADMWAVGCLLYELLSGQSPFPPTRASDQVKAVYPPLGDKVNRKLAELVERLVVVDPTLRPSPQAILQSLQTPDPRADMHTAIGKGSMFSSLLKTSTKSWVDNATSLNDTMPEMKYVEKLIAKAWQKPQKISKFYHFILLRPLNMTIIAIKALILFNKYLIHGPKEIITIRNPLNHDKFLSQVEEIWSTPNEINIPDGHRCEYFNGLIRQYCKILKTKVGIMQKFSLSGLWEGETNLTLREVEQFLSHWGRLNHFVKGLFLGVGDLPELRCGLAGLLLEEIFKMMKVVKQAIEMMLSKGNSQKNEQLVMGFNEEIAKSQSHVGSLQTNRPGVQIVFSFESYGYMSPLALRSQPKVVELPAVLESPKPGELSLNSKPYHSNRSAAPQISAFNSVGSAPPTPPEIPRPVVAEPSPPAQRIDPPKAGAPLFKPGQTLDPSHFGLGEVSWVIKETQLVQNEVIGGGSSCTVYKGTYKRTPVAIKILRSMVNGEHLKEFSRELNALLHLRHPNLVLFMGAVFTPQLAIVTEFCAGDTLFRLLHQDKQIKLSWKQKIKMCRDVAHGMTYLHESEPPILHRDLKSLNLLLTEKVTGPGDGLIVKITDFGVSKFLDDSVSMMNTGQMGTCHWMAPEVLAGHHYSLPADVYSYGIVIWEIVCRETPYRGLNPTLIPYRVLNCNERPSMELLPASCPQALRALMVSCWQTDPGQRPTFPQILDVLEGIEVTAQMDNLLI